ncbi:MAG: TonB family protein [Aureispira sp.]
MLLYLLESSCCWVVLYGFYALLLHREKTFGYNRAYLLFALFLGLIAPSLHLEDQVAPILLAPIDIHALTTPALENIAEAAPTALYWSFLKLLYLLGLLFFAGRFLFSLFKIQAIYKNSIVEPSSGYTLVTMKGAYPPFSFAHLLFVPADLVDNSKAYHCVLTHEAAHIQQAHSVDILLVELLQIIFWFNPILILYKMALRDQHEYLADQAVLRNTSVAQYGHLLLDQSVAMTLPLVHPFFHSSLKKRIIMMTTNSARFPMSKYAFSLLACLVTFWMMSCQKTAETPVEEFPDSFPYLASCEGSDKELQKKCSDQALLKYVYTHVKYPKSAKEVGAEGMAIVDFVVEKDGRIGAMEILRSTNNEALDAEALRVIQFMKAEGPLWKAGKKDGKAIAVTYKLPLRFKLK